MTLITAMDKPQVYYVNGTAVAVDGQHVFKDVIAKCSLSINELHKIANVIVLPVDEEGIYYLQNEGADSDYGEKTLIASGGVAAKGSGKNGSIGAILSPKQSYQFYQEGIQGIRDLLEVEYEERKLNPILMRLLFIGVCGEMEGYLHSTIIALIQGIKDVFISLRGADEQIEISDFVHSINKEYLFQHIRNNKSKERKIYEKLLGEHLTITQELRDCIEWRNKLSHKVPFHAKPLTPTKEDIIAFITETDNLVNHINSKIESYKAKWLY